MLARHETDFRADAQEPLSTDELLVLLGRDAPGDKLSREDAIACYLAGGEGWQRAMRLLGGNFASEGTGLKDDKGD